MRGWDPGPSEDPQTMGWQTAAEGCALPPSSVSAPARLLRLPVWGSYAARAPCRHPLSHRDARLRTGSTLAGKFSFPLKDCSLASGFCLLSSPCSAFPSRLVSPLAPCVASGQRVGPSQRGGRWPWPALLFTACLHRQQHIKTKMVCFHGKVTALQKIFQPRRRVFL